MLLQREKEIDRNTTTADDRAEHLEAQLLLRLPCSRDGRYLRLFRR